MTVEFHCEGCGVHVAAFGINRPPLHQFCAVCAWLCEHVPDPEEMWEDLHPVEGCHVMGTIERAWLCASCGYMMDMYTLVDGKGVAPNEDDLTLCLNCGAVHLRHAGEWRAMTEPERAALPPNITAFIRKAEMARRSIIRGDLSRRDGRA